MAEPWKVALTAGGVCDLVLAFLSEHPEHRQAFLADPAAALKSQLGVVLPASAVPVADTPDLVHVVVPADPNELGEADLGRVAGGTTLVAAESDSTQVDTTRQWRSRSGHLLSFDDNG